MELTDKETHLLAFSLFTTGMRIGPDVFATLESIAAKVGILDRFTMVAGDWLHYADTVRAADVQGKDLFQFQQPKSSGGKMSFDEWKAELIKVTARATGQSETAIKISDPDALIWYNDGFTPYQCFRETWNMENDAGV